MQTKFNHQSLLIFIYSNLKFEGYLFVLLKQNNTGKECINNGHTKIKRKSKLIDKCKKLFVLVPFSLESHLFSIDDLWACVQGVGLMGKVNRSCLVSWNPSARSGEACEVRFKGESIWVIIRPVSLKAGIRRKLTEILWHPSHVWRKLWKVRLGHLLA